MDDIRFHHIGVACNNIEKTAGKYLELGYNQSETIFDPLQNINICFLTHSHMPLVELLAPVDEKSPVVRILKNNGVTPYHTCYTTSDLESAIKSFRGKEYIVVSKPKEACAIDNKRVAFLFNKDIGLIELLESN